MTEKQADYALLYLFIIAWCSLTDTIVGVLG